MIGETGHERVRHPGLHFAYEEYAHLPDRLSGCFEITTMLSIAGMAMSAVGTISQGAQQASAQRAAAQAAANQAAAQQAAYQAQQQAAQYNASVANMNANIAQQDKSHAAQVAAQNTAQAQQKAAASIAAVGAARAASGLDLAGDTIGESERVGQNQNVLNTQAAGVQNANSFDQKIANYQSQAQLYQMQGSSAGGAASMAADAGMNAAASGNQMAGNTQSSGIMSAATGFVGYLGSKGVGTSDPYNSVSYANSNVTSSTAALYDTQAVLKF